MASIIPGFEYDIFISYRQKDNKHDGWVTEFVDNLRGELESTFKEEISVYFDINPHDGLLETHDVDASLKEKLKCLIFIPIISRTYCDPKSFAWEHEFKAFVEQASQDQFGLKVKLPNGNVANRVLPVRIHDLDNTDIKECESVLGGVLRGVEFIYKEPGVNKPLAIEDDEKKNLNSTKYRIQINKVSNAIKEIIKGLLAEPVKAVVGKDQSKESFEEFNKDERRINHERPVKTINRKLLYTIPIVALLIIAGIIAYPKIFKRDTLERLRSLDERISIAVMPFQNMTNDTIWNIWQDGIQDILITSLSDSEELKVRQAESVSKLVKGKGIINYASITPSVATSISQKLDANIMIYGSIKQAGNTTRLYAQLIDPGTEEVVKSFQIEGLDKEENIFHMVDSLSLIVKNFLTISKLEKAEPSHYGQLISTRSPEAYRYFVQGRNLYAKSNFLAAVNWFSKAIAIDSNFFQAIIMTSTAYSNQIEIETWLSRTYDKLYLYEMAKKWCLTAYEKIDQMPIQHKINTNSIFAYQFGTPYDEIKYLTQLIELDDLLPTAHFNIGNCYYELDQYEKAILGYEKALEIYNKWDIIPFWSANYNYLGQAYQKSGQYKKAAKVYKKAEQYFADDILMIGWQGSLSAIQGDTIAANIFFDRLVKNSRTRTSLSEATIASLLAFFNKEGGMLDEAEGYYRKALSLESSNPDRMNSLAYFLIDTERDTHAGLKLIEQALEMVPEYFVYLDTKGWGLYKQGKYPEALEILQKSWDLRREKAVYNHDAFLHLEAAKKVVVSQKNN